VSGAAHREWACMEGGEGRGGVLGAGGHQPDWCASEAGLGGDMSRQLDIYQHRWREVQQGYQSAKVGMQERRTYMHNPIFQ
jgi:hypothetical protein